MAFLLFGGGLRGWFSRFGFGFGFLHTVREEGRHWLAYSVGWLGLGFIDSGFFLSRSAGRQAGRHGWGIEEAGLYTGKIKSDGGGGGRRGRRSGRDMPQP